MWRIASIRAYGKQEDFKQESLRRIDRYSRAALTMYDLNRYVKPLPSAVFDQRIMTRF